MKKINLFIQRDGDPKTKLIQISSTEFIYDETSIGIIFIPASNEVEITINDGRKIKERKN